MSRRRRYRPRVRDASAPLILASAGYGWSVAHLAGFLLLGVLAVAAWPLVILGLTAAPAMVIGGCWPRRWRVAWRKRRADGGLGRGHAGHIPGWMRTAVYRADRWRCVHCGSTYRLQWDHVVPFACGGLTVLWNGAALCGMCNRLKSCYYPPWDGGGPRFAQQAAILASERRARRNPLRWLRMAYAL